MITFDIARKYKAVRPELNRVKRLGHKISYLEVVERDFVRRGTSGVDRRGRLLMTIWDATTIRATGHCEECGGTLVIERDTRSREADKLTVTGDVLAMECI